MFRLSGLRTELTIKMVVFSFSKHHIVGGSKRTPFLKYCANIRWFIKEDLNQVYNLVKVLNSF